MAADSWSLINKTGGVVDGDLTNPVDMKSATFTGALIGTANIHATSGALISVDSGTITVIPGTKSKLAFVQQPTDTVVGNVISPAVTVEITDNCGNRVTTAMDEVSIAIDTNPSAGTLTGTIPKAAVDGLATFGDLSLDKVGTGYTLKSTGLTAAISDAFDIIPAAAVSIDAPTEIPPALATDHTFTATVDITAVTNLDAASYEVMFDSTLLELTDVTAGTIDTTAIPVDHIVDITGGKRIVQSVPGTGGVSGEGTLATLHFTVLAGSGNCCNINLQNGSLSDKDANYIVASWTGDSAGIPVLLGDANDNGEVAGDSADIVKVKRMVAGIDSPTPGADANNNSSVVGDAADITKTKRFVAGLDTIVKLDPCP